MLDFSDVMAAARDFFNRGTDNANPGLTIFRNSGSLNSGGEQSDSWSIVAAGVAGHIQPEEGPLRALVGNTQLVQDWIMLMEPQWDPNGNPIIQANDLVCDGTVTVGASTPTGYQATGPVYRVQYVQDYFAEFWQVRMKVGQAARS